MTQVGFRTNTPFGHGAWLRASFYTGTTVEQAENLKKFMIDFARLWTNSHKQCASLCAGALEHADALGNGMEEELE